MASQTRSASKLGYQHYVCFPDDGRRHEIIDGDHYMNPAPATYHQRLSGRIHFQLYEQINVPGIGEVYLAPTDVQLTDHDIVQPDLIVVLDERRTIITPSKIKGIPHLVVEILSDSTINNDRVLKKELYERVGIPEYWIVDPEEHSVDQFVLANERYAHCGAYGRQLRSTTIASLTVDLNQVW